MSRDIADSMCRDIADRTLVAGVGFVGVAASAWASAGGLVGPGGIDGEPADEAVLAEDGDVVCAADDEELLAGETHSDRDKGLVPGEPTFAVDSAEFSSLRFGDGWPGPVGLAGLPSLGWGCPAEGSGGALVVVEGEPGVELGLEPGGRGGFWLAGEPELGGLMGPFELPAGLGMAGRRSDVANPEGGQ